jgi:uncharacterized membrane protein YfcA
MSPADVVLIAVAGLLCGMINTVAGGGSLILFPALLATGIPALAANVTNSVAGWPGYIGGVVGFRRELGEQRARLRTLAIVTIAGATTGSVLLLVTPASAFAVLVPGLVLFASVLVGVQPVLKRRLGPPIEGSTHARRVLLVSVFAATVYGGYFGGGLGIIVLAVLTLTVPDTLRNLTALKCAVALLNSTVTVVIFGLFGPVRWEAVAIAVPTTLIGGYVGASIARAVNETALRAFIVVFGVTVAIYLAVR